MQVKEAYGRIHLFSGALGQIKEAQRFQRMLKAVLVLGNKMNGVRGEGHLWMAVRATALISPLLASLAYFASSPYTYFDCFVLQVTAADKKKTVKAFTVNSLHQLYLTKAFDQQTSVLQYFIKLLKRKDPDLLRLTRDFKGPTLAEAKRLPLDVMTEEMKELREGLTSLEALVREAAQVRRQSYEPEP